MSRCIAVAIKGASNWKKQRRNLGKEVGEKKITRMKCVFASSLTVIVRKYNGVKYLGLLLVLLPYDARPHKILLKCKVFRSFSFSPPTVNIQKTSLFNFW